MRVSLFRRAAPDPDHISVVHGGELFRVAVRRRAAARRFTLRVSNATGEIVLTLPVGGDLKAATRFVEAHGAWIAARLQRLPERILLRPGDTVPLRGVPHRILHRVGERGPVAAGTDGEGRAVIAVSGEAPHVPRRVRDFLRREAERDLAEAVARHTAALGRRGRAITVRDTTSRWGSCTASGRLNFSWRLILAPPFVLDYLAAHEVAHLAEMNHSHRFWRVVHGLCPRTQEAERWLKRHGAELHRYG
ncbi:SprT family zinc-dependent metalloprotease [Chelatococcus sp. SYSU_G07232]|uniref:SprT family zinc-dependent metalloprotease n=1 Tax=Chelatococcus albus TaxID=3047466 RepID=A0ABT7AJP8_9HYPH|nr:SprT family zinc-dependent metalloprotease [Chelatococcus sp. SYSU_G07232]MDJ1158816.1 SprT family zinc-dependent metalloprotease [Chelatococcus sp. SYSU_G07232]